MARQGKCKSQDFSARIEQLEDRRVMSADPIGGLFGDFDQQIVDEQTPLVDQHTLADPDFWINPADADLLESYFQEIEQALTEAHNQTGWFNVKNNYGFTGRGQTVAVIDSGIAYDHFALGGGLGSNYRVVGGWDFTESDANPYDDGTKGGHGTHVSGIIGSNSGTHTGVAPGVDFVGLRVFNDAGAGYFSWVEKALQWVYDNRDSFENPITTVNLSLGVSSWNSASIPQWANLEDEFAKLESVGIFIAVSAGNSFGSYGAPGLSYPASSQYVIPVMSTDDSGALSSFSQRLTRAIAAPGRSIISTIPDYKGNKNGVADDFATMSGTSMAAPYVAGASVIIREAMEFVGMTNITQDMIYDHMMATADTIYDAVTKLSYKRLDLQAAIDALMPADDYGSTLAAAHNLGTLSGSSSVSGRIGSLTDVDYFRFTAGANGNVTFDLSTATGGMAGVWQAFDANGQAIKSQNGDTFTFAVTAGQTYSIRLASTDGMGQYTFDVTASSATITPIDWGAVSFNQLSGIGVAGEGWYRVQATRDGLLSVLAQFNANSGNVNLELYSANMQLVAAGTTADGQARVDATAAAGTEFYIRVTGSSSAVDFKLVNLVSQVGSTVNVYGTAGDDVFSFTAGATYQVSVNGVSYSFAKSAANKFAVHGGAGNDSIAMTGSSDAEKAVLRVGSAALGNSRYSAVATDVESVRVNGGGGADAAVLYDSAGDDHLISRQDFTTMTGVGLDYYVAGFADIEANATQGNDKVELYDSAGGDRFQGKVGVSTLRGAGYSRTVAGFDSVYAYSLAGGNDTAELWDSSGADIFMARPTYSTMRTSTTLNSVHSFENVFAYATAGGRDLASLYDSPLNDVFVTRPFYTYVRGSNFYNLASGFESVRTYSSAGGKDLSLLYGSAGNETVIVEKNQTRLYGTGYELSAHGFANTRIVGMGGKDTVRAEALDTKDAVFGRGNVATITRGASTTRVEDLNLLLAVQLAGKNASIDVEAVDYLFERLLK